MGALHLYQPAMSRLSAALHSAPRVKPGMKYWAQEDRKRVV
jgi:hypothetical protein